MGHEEELYNIYKHGLLIRVDDESALKVLKKWRPGVLELSCKAAVSFSYGGVICQQIEWVLNGSFSFIFPTGQLNLLIHC